MKRKKEDTGTPPGAPAEPKLVLRRRSVASLSDDQLSDAAGGHPHTCHPTCPPTCCGDTCRGTCDPTCQDATCNHTCDNQADTCGWSCVIHECTDPIP